MRLSQLKAGAANWTASVVLSDAAAVPQSLALAVRSDGRIALAWADGRSGNADLYLTSFDQLRGTWSAPALASDDPGSAAQLRPAIVLNTSETALAWRDDRSGNADIRARLSGFVYSSGNPILLVDASGLQTGGICLSLNFGLGGYATYQVCPVVVAVNGDVGWTGTLGAGLSPSASASVTGGIQLSNAHSISQLRGPFTQTGGSAGEGLVGGTDYFWSDDVHVQGFSGQVGYGLRLTGFAPLEIHGATTNTIGGAYFNIFDIFRRLLGRTTNKVGCGC